MISHIHAIHIPFRVPIAPDRFIEREVYAYLVVGETLTLIDCGVAGSAEGIFEAVRGLGRDPAEITTLILSHAHPDHLGAARSIREATGCRVWAHGAERHWIEDTERQGRERPVPGFQTLVEGPVAIDRLLIDGETLSLASGLDCQVIHTPGHSPGSISLFFAGDRVLTTADSLPVPNDLPIYDDIAQCVASIRKIKALAPVSTILSSWEPPIRGREAILPRIEASMAYLRRIHAAVLATRESGVTDPLAICHQVVQALGLPSLAVNPLVARSFASSLAAEGMEELFRADDFTS